MTLELSNCTNKYKLSVMFCIENIVNTILKDIFTLFLVNSVIHANFFAQRYSFLCKLNIFTKTKDIETILTKELFKT